MDIITSAVLASNPGAPPQQVYITINGTAVEFELIMAGMQRALSDGPQAVELKTLNGVPVRIVIDRLGPAVTPGN